MNNFLGVAKTPLSIFVSNAFVILGENQWVDASKKDPAS